MKLGTRLTLYLSLIIIPVLSGYGYFDILSRRDILIRKMKAEVSGTGMTLKVSLEKISPQEEKGYIQGLIDAVSELIALIWITLPSLPCLKLTIRSKPKKR